MVYSNPVLAVPSQSRLQTLTAALLAIGFGAFLLFAAGFAQPDAVHNAAHDSRHTFAFPCH